MTDSLSEYDIIDDDLVAFLKNQISVPIGSLSKSEDTAVSDIIEPLFQKYRALQTDIKDHHTLFFDRHRHSASLLCVLGSTIILASIAYKMHISITVYIVSLMVAMIVGYMLGLAAIALIAARRLVSSLYQMRRDFLDESKDYLKRAAIEVLSNRRHDIESMFKDVDAPEDERLKMVNELMDLWVQAVEEYFS